MCPKESEPFIMATRSASVSWRLMSCYCREMRTMSINSMSKTEKEQPFYHCTSVKHRGERTKNPNPITIPFRSIFNVPGIGDKKKEYEGRKLVGYSMDQMYAVVADVENYKKFVPFCKKSLVRSKTPQHMRADLVIGFPPIHESYTSSITLHKPYLVRALCTEGKLFNHLLTEWKFSPGLKENHQSCVINFSVTFEFRSLLHSQLAHIFFNEVVRQMEEAFLHEATNRFGKASIKTQRLSILSVNS